MANKNDLLYDTGKHTESSHYMEVVSYCWEYYIKYWCHNTPLVTWGSGVFDQYPWISMCVQSTLIKAVSQSLKVCVESRDPGSMNQVWISPTSMK